MRDTHFSTAKSPEEIIQAIFELDLDIVKQQLRDEKDGEGWTVDQANYYEMEYKQFLALAVKYPGQEISPSKNVDAFWHTHILNTRKYVEDCQKTFGYFVHHEPGARTGSKEEQAHYEKSFNRFQSLKEKEFGSAANVAEGGKAGAYCALSSDRQGAYCALSDGIEVGAYCALATMKKENAYCALASRRENGAYCALSLPTEKTAYCALSSHSGRAAYCALASADKQMAYCALFSDREQAAYCALAKEMAGEK